MRQHNPCPPLAQVAAVAVLGITVIASFAIMWGPYLSSVEELLKVARFPRLSTPCTACHAVHLQSATFCSVLVRMLPLPLAQVLGRIFPLRRGLYEDYLANWWCATSVAIKWKALLPADVLVRVCAALTLAAAAPSMAQQILAPSPQGLLLAMTNSAFAFYMFGYQVRWCLCP